MSKNRNRNKNWLLNRLVSKGCVFDALVVSFVIILSGVVGISATPTPAVAPATWEPEYPLIPPELLSFEDIGNDDLKVTINGIVVRGETLNVELEISTTGDKGVYIENPSLDATITDEAGIIYEGEDRSIPLEKFRVNGSVKEVVIITPEVPLWGAVVFPRDTPLTNVELRVSLSSQDTGVYGGAWLKPIKAGVSASLLTRGPAPTTASTQTPTSVPGEDGFKPEEGAPGFEAIFAIAGIVVIAYLFKRRKVR
jgi:hypothetical protein